MVERNQYIAQKLLVKIHRLKRSETALDNDNSDQEAGVEKNGDDPVSSPDDQFRFRVLSQVKYQHCFLKYSFVCSKIRNIYFFVCKAKISWLLLGLRISRPALTGDRLSWLLIFFRSYCVRWWSRWFCFDYTSVTHCRFSCSHCFHHRCFDYKPKSFS